MTLRCLCVLILAALLCWPSLARGEAEVQKVRPLLFTLQGALTEPAAEISGLAWHGELLVLLPQYPDFDTDRRQNPAALFGVRRGELLARIRGRESTPLPHEEIAVRGLEACRRLPGFEGFEAIAVQGDTAWLLVEARHKGRMRAWLLQGRFVPDAAASSGLALELAEDSITELHLPVNLRNVGFETLILARDAVFAVFEGNGRNVTPEPRALRFATGKPLPQEPQRVAFPHVEFRVTDATAVREAQGRQVFHVMNYYWPGEKKRYRPARDAIAERFGLERAEGEPVERVLQLELTPSGMVLTDAPPLLLAQGFLPRNWEGLAALDADEVQGLLLATDKYPGTLLGYVPLR